MAKKRIVPSDQENTRLELWQLSGFWLLRSVTEIAFLNQKKCGSITTKFKNPISVLIETKHMSLIWHEGTANARTVSIQIYRGKVVTRPLLEQTQIRANCERKGILMNWQFVINRNENDYSKYLYEFIQVKE
jgi:hypothetical protein